jgi:hypothetical protein
MSVYAVLKASYHWIHDPSSLAPNIYKPDATGGFLGSAFFVNDNVALSAYHVLNEKTFNPDLHHTDSQIWLVSKSGVSHEIELIMMEFHPKLDLTIVRFKTKQNNVQKLELNTDFTLKTEIFNEGFPDFGPPNVKFEVAQIIGKGPGLRIISADLKSALFKKLDYVKSISKETVNKNDIKLNNVEIIRTSYGGKKGMSGSPLIKSSDGTVIGLMSHGYPQDIEDKTELCAISTNEFSSLI